MKNNALRGTKAVYCFSLQQHYKAISVKILLIILCVLGFAVVPLINIFSQKHEADFTDVQTLYIRNDTTYPFDIELLKQNPIYSEIEFLETETSDDNFGSLLASSEKKTAALTISMNEESGISTHVLYSEETDFSSSDLESLAQAASDVVYQGMLKSLSITGEQLSILDANSVSTVETVSEYVSDGDEADFDTHNFVTNFYCYLILLLSTMAMAYILSLCLEEKMSKLVETLLVSIDPMVLMIGKILAATTFIFVGLLAFVVPFLISLLLAKSRGDVDAVVALMDRIGISNLVDSITLSDLLLAMIGVILAYSIISLICSIVGSCCSKTDDIQSASLIVMLMIMVGYTVALISPLFSSEALNIVMSLFPLTAIFVAPTNFVCGKIGIGILILSFAIQIAAIVFLAKLAGKTYQMMILYRGGFPSFKQYRKMLQANRAEGKERDTK